MPDPARVTVFAPQSNGCRSFGVTVNGFRILVTASEGRHDLGADLAATIADLGPEADPAEPLEAPHVPEPPPIVAAPPRRAFQVGQRVWCNVRGSLGYCTVTEVGTGRRRGAIKISGYRAWCPISNFDAHGPEERP